MPMSVTYTNYNGRIVAENRGGTETLFLPDTLGNVIETRDMNTGAKTSETTYWPYGEIRNQTGTNPSPFGFCGIWGYYSSPNLPTYVRARYYRPAQGRWQTVDPLWPSQPMYNYCTNSPTTYVDPLGLKPPWATTPVECKVLRCSDLLTLRGIGTTAIDSLDSISQDCFVKNSRTPVKLRKCLVDKLKGSQIPQDILEKYIACMIASCHYTDIRCGDNICDQDLDPIACCQGHGSACMIMCGLNLDPLDVFGIGFSICLFNCKARTESCLARGGQLRGEDNSNPWP